MKKFFLILIALVLLGGMVGCGAPTPAPTPDTRGAIVEAGFVTAKTGQPPVDMRIGPSLNYGVIGQIKPGDTAGLVGVNLAGDWLLVNYNDRVGWVQVALVDYTISQ